MKKRKKRNKRFGEKPSFDWLWRLQGNTRDGTAQKGVLRLFRYNQSVGYREEGE